MPKRKKICEKILATATQIFETRGIKKMIHTGNTLLNLMP
jgi:hypothetical protein